MSRRRDLYLATVAALMLSASAACAQTAPPDSSASGLDDDLDSTSVTMPAAKALTRHADHLEHLNPEIGMNPYHLEPGVRPYQDRLSISPGYGNLGSRTLFTFRVAYNPNSWLGYEASLDHNPGQSVHAVVNSINAIVRHPFPGRVQPYVIAGYGMILVFPGQALKADPVTKNALSAGGGSEFYIRSDLAIRGEVKGASVIGRQTNGVGMAAYDYLQWTVGLSFYRSIRP